VGSVGDDGALSLGILTTTRSLDTMQTVTDTTVEEAQALPPSSTPRLTSIFRVFAVLELIGAALLVDPVRANGPNIENLWLLVGAVGAVISAMMFLAIGDVLLYLRGIRDALRR